MPGSFDKKFARAKALIDIARYREAIAELSALVASETAKYEVLCRLAFCHYHLDEMRTALGFARDAVAFGPEKEWAYRLVSLCYSALGIHERSLEAAREAVNKAPGEPFSLQALAYAQINNFMLDHAEETARHLLAIAPGWPETHDVLGYLALKREYFSAAEKHFLKALEIEPGSVNSLNNLGAVYLAQSQISLLIYPGRGRMARDCFLSALKIRPTFEAAQKNLEAAESNHNFLGGKGTRVFIGMQAVFLLTIVLSNVACRFLPALVNLYVSYRPAGFYVGMNIILVAFLLIWVFGLIAMRRARMNFIVDNFKGKSIRALGFGFIMLLVQALYGTFLILLDAGFSGIGWLIFVALGGGILLTALRIFGYYDAKVPD